MVITCLIVPSKIYPRDVLIECTIPLHKKKILKVEWVFDNK